MTSLTQKCFSLNLKLLQIMFLYSPEKPTKWKTVQSYLVFISFMFHIPITNALFFFSNRNLAKLQNLNDNNNTFVSISILSFLFKLLPFLTNPSKIKTCIHYFDLQIFTKLEKSQVEIIERAVRICRRNALFLAAAYAGALTSFVFQLLYMNKLPIDVWLPYDPFTNLATYYGTFIWLLLGVGYTVIGCAAVDPLLTGLAWMAAAHLSVIGDKLQNLKEYVEQNIRTNIKLHVLDLDKYDEIFRTIQECIKHHHAILEFAKLYEDCFSLALFSQLFGSIFIIGFCCLQIISAAPFSVEFMTSIHYLVLLLMEIYFYCFFGAALSEKSDNLSTAVYMSEWYEYNVKSRKALIILLERSKRPIVIKVGKLLDLSLVTFTTICRRGYSLLAILHK